MRANLKEMYSLELSTTMEEYRPEILENFGLSVRLMVGQEGEDGTESFDVLVCTADWIKDQLTLERCIWGRHMLVVQEYDYALILELVSVRIASCDGKDRAEVANKLARIAAWEFEDYRP